VNYETANKETNINLYNAKIDELVLKEMATHGPQIDEIADKKTADNEGRVYSSNENIFGANILRRQLIQNVSRI
jgi:hypothetical protein